MNLKAIREMKGYPDQRSLADALGVNQSTVQRMEAAAPTVTLRQFHQAAELLGVTLAEIFADERSAAETVLLRQWRSLGTEEERDIWIEHLRIAASGKLPSAENR